MQTILIIKERRMKTIRKECLVHFSFYVVPYLVNR